MIAKSVAIIRRNGRRVAFRSTLEARWAVFFDLMGFKWQYEPFRFDLNGPGKTYTPDFEVDEIGIIEVKPTAKAFDESRARVAEYIRQTGNRVYLVYGNGVQGCIDILHGSPMAICPTSEMQRVIILGGRGRRKAAIDNFHFFQDSIWPLLKQAFENKISSDALTWQEHILLDDTRAK